MIVQGALILVADTDPGIRALLTDGLEFRGFRVAAVQTAAEAISAIESERPSLALVDLGLLVDGVGDLSARLVQAPDRVPLIVMTADAEGAALAAQLGAIACVAKPIDLDRLFASIRSTSDGTS
jgi:DNA-binding response OmpR family regulator